MDSPVGTLAGISRLKNTVKAHPHVQDTCKYVMTRPSQVSMSDLNVLIDVVLSRAVDLLRADRLLTKETFDDEQR